MDSEVVVNKIKKLLALSTSSNVNEAQNAMLKAQELMIKNELSMQDVSCCEKKEVLETSAVQATRFPWYAYNLSAKLANNFRCYSITSRYRGNRYIKFVGLKDDVKTVIEVYSFALQYMKGQIREFRQKITMDKSFTGKRHLANAFCNDFARGFLSGLEARFAEQVSREEWGLVLVRDEEVEKYHTDMHLKTAKKHCVSTADDDEAWAAGYYKGKRFEMVAGTLN